MQLANTISGGGEVFKLIRGSYETSKKERTENMVCVI